MIGRACAPRLVEPIGFRYKVTPSWVRSVLSEGAAHPCNEQASLQSDVVAFTALLALLRHGAMGSDAVPKPAPGLAGKLERSFGDSRVKAFVADARALPDEVGLAIRSGGVHLRTDNRLTARFLPPSADEVSAALGIALKAIQSALERHRGKAARVAACALIGSQIMLTIHPFPDGNGRTARMFFAAQLLRYQVPAPTALLGMMLMYRGGAHRYHQASWELRAGNVEPMVELFAESTTLADERFMRHARVGQSPEEFLAACWRDLREMR